MTRYHFIYLSAGFILVFFSYLFIDPNFFYLERFFSNFAFQNRVVTTFLYLFILVLFYSFFVLTFVERGSFKRLKVNIILVLFVLLFAYPTMLSHDIFNYIATAKITFSYGENPYIVMPIEFVNDPVLRFTHAANKIALYGPFWITLTGIPFLLGLGNYLLTIFTFKLFVALFYIGIVSIIWRVTQKKESVLFFALNPLVVFETFVSGHNDVVMMFFALAAFLSLKSKKHLLALLLLLLSILIKYATLFLIPVFIYALILQITGKRIEWNKIYFWAFLSMLVVFLLAPVRDEMYPWYAIWFLTFLALIPEKKAFWVLSIFFSFGLQCRYIPFMMSGNHFGLTPYWKITLTYVPVIIGFVILYVKKISFR